MEKIKKYIGNTPLIKATNIMEKYSLCANLYLKLENKNYSGSIKDRLVYKILCDALSKKLITKDTTIIEATSGNTGISLCAICNHLNLKCIIVMPEGVSKERIELIKKYHGNIILTKKELGITGSINHIENLKKQYPNNYSLNQFENKLGILAHYETTAYEIYNDLNKNVDIFIAGIGTGTTFTGVSKYLKEKNKNTLCIGILPKNANPLNCKKTTLHQIEGIGSGFIPKLLDLSLLDEIIEVTDEDAINYTKVLYKIEKLKCGISSGAALYSGIIEGKKEENKNKNIIVILPDSGDRYLSKGVFI